MSEMQQVGAIGLECLMSRAHIIFTSGYKFRGSLDEDALQRSFLAVVDNVAKFQYRLCFEAQGRFSWEKHGPFKNRFLLLESEDIEQEFKSLCGRSMEFFQESGQFPMLMALIRQKGGAEEEFIIAQLSEHTHTDAGSSEVIFNKVIEYYNALVANDEATMSAVLDSVQKMKTLDAESMIELLKKDGFDHATNVEKLQDYPIEDVGEHKVPLHTIPGHLENYRQRFRSPVIRYFPIGHLVQQCRAEYPEVTKNSVVSAALAKGVYDLNVDKRGKPDQHLVSFKMLSNILPVDIRHQYSGNYISFVPVTVDGHAPLKDIARDIHQRIREFKTTQLNLSLFRLVEEAVEAEAVGGADEELSYIVTNWNNYRFLNNPDFLSGCRSIRHISGVNIEPKDTLGGSLVNRPVMVISLSPGDELCLSFFPSLRSDDETNEIMEHIARVFDS
jgi:hypothetical protein